MGGGATHNHDNLLAVCDAPSTVYTIGHIFVVLRRILAEIASPSPSPRRRAAGTHPLPSRLAGSGRRRTSPRWTCAERGGVVHSVLDQLDHEESLTTSTALWNASAYGLRGHIDTLSPSLLCISMDRSLRVRRIRIFFCSPCIISQKHQGQEGSCNAHDAAISPTCRGMT